MRVLLSGLVAAGLLTSQIASAACLSPADQAAFDVTGLKTQLMVTALTCGGEDRYNAFIARYRPDLLSHERNLNTYFNRTYGRAGAKRHDDFITNLSNVDSRAGLRDGTLFCEHNVAAFDEVMALRSSAELPEYAAARAAPDSSITPACATGTERAVGHTTRASVRRRH
jgi:hypothetical protein